MQFLRYNIFLFILLIPVILFSQMQDWKFFKDREGNKYFLDSSGKIYITSLPASNRKTVSADGIDYYINFAEEILSRKKIVDSLLIFKSILALPENNNRINSARVRAAKNIDNLKKNNGDRFDKYNNEASLLFYKTGGRANIINDAMLYSLSSKGKINLIRFKIRKDKDEIYHGASVGINYTEKEINDNKYETLIAVDAVKKKYSILSLEEMSENWKIILGKDILERNELFRNNDTVIYEFSSGHDGVNAPLYKGFEVQKYNGNFIYFLRIVSSGIKFEKLKDSMRDTALSFKTVASVNFNYPQ
jgi:hypothetical protein